MGHVANFFEMNALQLLDPGAERVMKTDVDVSNLNVFKMKQENKVKRGKKQVQT